MSEVRPYLKRLLAVIFVGIVMMASTAWFAWNKYGQRLKTAPPLPEPAPFHRVPEAQ
jgi:hypothetical protein